MNILDRAISVLSPESALKRERARIVLGQVRKFESASKGTPRTKNWRAIDSGPNTEIGSSLSILRARSRQLNRDSAIAKRITDVIVNSVVSDGVIAEVENNERADIVLNDFLESTELDFENKKNYYAMQRLVIETLAVSGEVLVRRVINPKFKYGVKFQILEPDFVDHTKNENFKDGSYTLQGVKYSHDGLIQGYFIFPEHPNDAMWTKKGFTSEFKSIDEFRLIFDQKRPGQARGYPHNASVMINIKDLTDTIGAEVVRRKIASLFAGFITNQNGEFDDEESDFELDRINPGTLSKLNVGEDIKFNSPPQTQDFSQFVNTQLRIIAVGSGITYESLSSDLTNVNFSSARMGRMDFIPSIKHLQENVLISQFCEWVCDSFLFFASTKNLIPENLKIIHTRPQVPLIDPVQENNADKNAIRAGLDSYSNILRARGKDPKKVLRELSEDLKLIKSLGLVLDIDGTVVSLAGNKQEDTNNGGNDDKKP